uniref:SAG-related sequence SRS37B n=2 Tax=Toxoplasma gondii TaxID=5811 RepID=A0A2G8Y092_TOXGO|nr:SAG-related sequence SRS37B [Toxoplasma gondii COUG]
MRILSGALLALGASISLAFSWALTIAAAKSPLPSSTVKECTGTAGIELNFPTDGTTVQFKCSSKFKKLVPSDTKYVYEEPVVPTVDRAALHRSEVGATEEDPPGHTKKLLTSLYERATLTGSSEEDNIYTLQIPKESRVTEKVLKVFCKDDANDELRELQGYCPVTITVPKNTDDDVENDDSSDTEQLPDDVVTCTARSRNPKVTVSKDNQRVQLICGPKDTSSLKPDGALHVFDNKNGKCNEQATLSELVPGATRSDKDSGNGAYTVTFPKLPSEKQALCYSCSASGHPGLLRTEPCQIHIEVSAATTATTTMPTTSDAVTRVQAALGQTTAGVLFASIVGVACLA